MATLQKLMAANATYNSSNYYNLNFDDYYNSVALLWCLTIVNNWFVFADAFAIVTTNWAKTYFFMWFFMSVTYGTSVVTALFLLLFLREVDAKKV